MNWSWGNGGDIPSSRPELDESGVEQKVHLALTQDDDIDQAKLGDEGSCLSAARLKNTVEPSCRLRFYFQPNLSDARFEQPSITAAGKRKKCDDDDDDNGDRKSKRRRSPSQSSHLAELGRLSPANSEPPGLNGDLDHASETDDSDWLMKAIGEDSSEGGIALVSPAQAEIADASVENLENVDEQDEKGLDLVIDGSTGATGPASTWNVIGSLDKRQESPQAVILTEGFEVQVDEHGNKRSCEPVVGQLALDDGAELIVSDSPALVGNIVVADFELESKEETVSLTGVDRYSPNPKELSLDSIVKGHTDQEKVHQFENGANRISLLYADSQRRLTIDAAIVDKVHLHRTEGRLELLIRYEPDASGSLGRGIRVSG